MRICSVILLLFLIACSGKEAYSEFRSFPNSEWDLHEAVRFKAPIKNISQAYDIFFEIRNTNDYSYRNLWLFVDYQMPKGQVRSDTINVELADDYGKWYGTGIGLFSYTFPYELNVQYPDTGTYTYTIRQGMRNNPLTGISDIGLIVRKKTDQ